MTSSSLIDAVIAAAEAEGNHLEGVWEFSEMREVAWMAHPMSNDLRSRIVQKKDLRYWSAEGTPHNRADEGFTDDVEKVSIAFPREFLKTRTKMS
jgi:hypothetical protein